MARTAPAPNAAVIPGMCPGVFVLGGGGSGGGGSGPGAGGGAGGQGAGGGGGGQSATGDGRGAPDPSKYPECGTVSHPIDVVTGRVFTHPIEVLALPGPLPLVWERAYSSAMADRDAGLGYGWGHTLGWEIEVRRRRILVRTQQGTAVEFPMLAVGEAIVGKWGFLLRREAWGYVVDAGDDLLRVFSFVQEGGARVRLTAVEDRNKNRISVTYEDTDGRMVEVTDSAGRRIRLRAVTSKEEWITSIELQSDAERGEWLPLGTLTRDSQGDLIAATDAERRAWRSTYHEDHLLASDTDRVGLTWHFVYDAKRRGIEAWGEYPGKKDPSLVSDMPRYLHDKETRYKGIHHCKVNSSDIGYTEVIDFSQARHFYGNRHGTLDKRVVGGGVMTATYRDDGWLTSRTNALGGTELFTRNERGSIVRYTDELGRVTLIERDASDLPIEIVNAKGGAHKLERDPRGNVTLYVDPTGAVTSRRYDARGRVIEEISPKGERMIFAHDAQGNLIRLTLANGAAWRWTYDALGRRLTQTDPLGAETRYAWSARGDLVAVTDAAGGVTQYAYDGEHHLTEIVDAKGGVTSFVWGGFHKLCVRRDANGHEVRLGYNLEGELVEVRNEKGEVHHLTRDRADR